ncbi:MAG: tripartite tricarboxylate transporter substrate binding protein [Betaproteobacteria bacterium]
MIFHKSTSLIFIRLISFFCFLCAVCCKSSFAQTFPNKPITLIVSSAPAGPLDAAGRMLSDYLSKRLGRAVVIENRPGASGAIAAGILAKAPADGYTLMISTRAITINPALYHKLPFDTGKDFVPVAMVMEQVNLLVVSKDFPARTVPQLIKILKDNPDKYSFGSPGNGGIPHLAGEMFKSLSGTSILHIPYKGAAPLMTDLLGGRVDMTFSSPGTALAQVNEGKVFPIAIASEKRSSLLPNIPTFSEYGLKGFNIDSWYGVFAPSGTPAEITRLLNQEINNYLKTEDARKRITNLGASPVIMTSEEFKTIFDDDIIRFSKLVRQLAIGVD